MIPLFIVTNTSRIRKGEAGKLADRFDKIGKVEFMPGFLGLEVWQSEKSAEHDLINVVTRWERMEDFHAWTRSDAFRESHSGRQVPDYILDNTITQYEVKVVREPRSAAAERDADSA
ncbi:heme oxygenase [Paenibacillus sp. B01]|uniref:heme oxygenase n=1 Tax=Paenibacillus sp. B01 TaxID=2660554 RepID=UPI002B2781D3|nr:heme oxygenase [Paenibacillus sp. B01]